MERYPVTPVSTPGQEDANPGNRDDNVAFEEEIGEGSLSLNAVIAAEKLAARTETIALAVLAAEAVVAMALTAVRVVADPLDEAAQETLLVAKKAAAKTLLLAKEGAEETLKLATEVAKVLEEEIKKGSISLNVAIAAEKLAALAEKTALAVLDAEARVSMTLSAARVVAGPSNEAAQETLVVAQKAAAKTLQVAKEDAKEVLMLAREVAKELLEEASRKSARNASSPV